MTGKRIGRKKFTITLSKKELYIVTECVGSMAERLEGLYIVRDRMDYLYSLCRELNKVLNQSMEVD